MHGASALQRFPLTVGSLIKGALELNFSELCSLTLARNTCQMQSRFLENILVLFNDLGLSTLCITLVNDSSQINTYRKNRAWSLILAFLNITHV